MAMVPEVNTFRFEQRELAGLPPDLKAIKSVCAPYIDEQLDSFITWCADVFGYNASNAIGPWLWELNELAYRPDHTRNKALACLNALSAACGISRAQLEDRLVPFCGMGGRVIFDYGPRQFQLVLGDRSTPLLRAADGRMFTKTPRMRPDDDSELAVQAANAWRSYKDLLASTSKVQTRRFEQAMIDQRRWTPAEFAHAILGNPLLAELARRLIWAGYAADGSLQSPFCLADQGCPASEEYQPLDLQDFATIGIPHPVHVAPERRQRWGELLADFHVAPIFAQAARPVFDLAAANSDIAHDTRFGLQLKNCVFDDVRFGARIRQPMGRMLSSDGWELMSHYGWYSLRFFEGAQITAIVVFKREQNDLILSDCFFVNGPVDRAQSIPTLTPMPLREVEPVVLSEVFVHLQTMMDNPKYLYQG